MDYRIFDVDMWSFCMCILYTWPTSAVSPRGLQSAHILTPEKSQCGRKAWHVTVTQRCDDHTWSCLTWLLRGVLLLCVINSPFPILLFYSIPVDRAYDPSSLSVTFNRVPFKYCEGVYVNMSWGWSFVRGSAVLDGVNFCFLSTNVLWMNN